MNLENNKLQEPVENTIGMTPSALLHYHMQHPEAPITDEEIRSTVITEAPVDAPPKNTSNTKAEIKQEKHQKNERDFPIQTPYEVLDGGKQF